MPGNYGKSTNTVMIFSMYCFVLIYKYVTWQYTDAVWRDIIQ